MMDDTVQAFLRVLDPADNSTGGGTASAMAGAMAAALVAMVARLSRGKVGMEPEAFYGQLAAEAEGVSADLFRGARLDSEAFDAVRTAYRLPKEAEAEKANRRRAIQEAMVQAARVPLSNAEGCRRAFELGSILQGRSNPHAASDLECAIHLARAGILGCLANVRINLPSIQDARLAEELEVHAERLQAVALQGLGRVG